jgi:Peptidase M10 serralysin C terminal
MNDIADATPEQITTLLAPGPNGSYFRPYASNTIEVSFMTAMPLYEGNLAIYNASFQTGSDGQPLFAAFSAEEQVNIRAAFAAISKVANIEFRFTDSPGVGAIRLGKANVMVRGKVVGGANVQDGVDYQTPFVNDVYLPKATTLTDLDFGRDGFLNVLHEIGHALGLKKHPNEAGFSIDIQLSRAVSMMSYADWLGPNGLQDRKAMTPLLLDILALQTLWGKSESAQTGNTTYSFNPNSTAATTNASETEIYKTQTRTIWDSDGIDTLDAKAYGKDDAVTLDLRPGFLSSIGGKKNVGIAFNTVIENATGGSGKDTLIGNDVANILAGGNGDDKLQGGAGVDTYLFTTDPDRAKDLAGWGTDIIRDSGYGHKSRENRMQTAIRDTYHVYLGIKLDSTQRIALIQGHCTTVGASHAHVYADISFEDAQLDGHSSNLNERGGKPFNRYLAQAAHTGDTLTLAAGGGLAGKLKVILGKTTVDADGAVITLGEGDTFATFALVSDSAIEADFTGSLSATFAGVGAANSNVRYALNTYLRYVSLSYKPIRLKFRPQCRTRRTLLSHSRRWRGVAI